MSAVASRIFEVQLESFEARPPIMGLASQPLVSFDEALDPIPFDEKDLIKRISRLYCHEGGKLSIDEKRAIYAYCCEGGTKESSLYAKLNGSLRHGDRRKVKPYLAFIKLFNSALSKCMVKIVRSLWRGVSLDLYDEYISKIGMTIVFWGYTSTTIDMKALDCFIPIDAPHRTLFNIRVNAAADVREYSALSEEQEIVILAGTAFKVLNVHRTATNLTFVELDEVENLLDPDVPALIPAAMDGLAPAKDAASARKVSDGQAIYEEGLRHEGELGEGKDIRRARECYEVAARYGHAAAQSKVGRFHYFGWGGLAESKSEALRYYRMGADQGDALGQCGVGVCYYNGEGGLAKDASEAVRWYRLAADQGNAIAQYNLGVCCAKGEGGLAKDAAEAAEWYRLAADQGHEKARNSLSGMRLDSECESTTVWPTVRRLLWRR